MRAWHGYVWCLGEAAPLWADLVAHVAGTCPPLKELWSFAGAKFGWSLRLKRAVASAAGRGLLPAVLVLLDAAPRYAEGRGIRLTIAPGDDLDTVRHLVALKAEVAPKGRRNANAMTPRDVAGR